VLALLALIIIPKIRKIVRTVAMHGHSASRCSVMSMTNIIFGRTKN
jgi:hypothetical protein